MVEVIACDEHGVELPELGQRFHDCAAPEILIDGCAYGFVRFKTSGVALYRRRATGRSTRAGAPTDRARGVA